MSDGTKIEWTDATWNPVTGCTRVSEGCLNCYIDRTPPFRMAHRRFTLPGEPLTEHVIGETTGVQIHEDRLTQPLRWRKPRRIFVCSLADLFHADVPDEYIARVWAVMALASQHTFQVLTKRAARLRGLLSSPGFREMVVDAGAGSLDLTADAIDWLASRARPLPNVWVGVSAEDQKWADTRIPLLLDTPAAVRWVSAEPLLGRLDLGEYVRCGDDSGPHHERHGCTLDWVVAGGESGPAARLMQPDWARSLRDQCEQAGVAFLFKQWGEWGPVDLDGRGIAVRRAGKKAAGRTIDGRTHDDYPAERAGTA